MLAIRSVRERVLNVLAGALFGLPLLVQGVQSAEPLQGVDPEAIALLRKMTDSLAQLEQFRLEGHGSVDVVLSSGQKIQFDNDVALLVQRPNKLLATRQGEDTEQSLYYDGSSLSLHDRKEGYYATATAPATLDGALTFAAEQLDLFAPAADLLYADAFDLLTADMTEGFVVDEQVWMNNRQATHLAFRKPGVDIQIWISNGPQPLPLKYVLTTTDMMSSPQFAVTVTDWDSAPKIDASSFHFTPPPGSGRIEFVRTGSAPDSAN